MENLSEKKTIEYTVGINDKELKMIENALKYYIESKKKDTFQDKDFHAYEFLAEQFHVNFS